MNAIKDLTITADSGTAFTYKGVKPDTAIRYCTCECGQQVVKKAIYRPGHDARHISNIAIEVVEAPGRSLTKTIRAGYTQLGSAKLVAKLAARLVKLLPEGKAEMVMTLAAERIEAIEMDDEGDE